jgi:hypothetical protein
MNLTDAASLEFLLNPIYTQGGKKGDKKTSSSKDLNKVDVKFYRKRIEAMTKTLLKGGAEMPFQEAYVAYVNSVIGYFKAIDRHELVQEQLLHTEPDVISSKEGVDASGEAVGASSEAEEVFSLQKADEVMQVKNIQYANLDNYVKTVVVENNNETSSRIIPMRLDLNLQTPALKRKGVRPKKGSE